MTTDLDIALVEGAHRIDSRLLAGRLGYDHKVVLQSIRRHKTRLEAKSALLQNEAVLKHEGYRGSTRQSYYLLDERQCLILAGSLKKGSEADEWHDLLVDAFLQARAQVRELEARSASGDALHTCTAALRERALVNLNNVPDGYFCVPLELMKHLYNLEALLNQALDQMARLEISVGLCWATYAQAELRLPNHVRRKYPHQCQDGRIVWAWAYPISTIIAFDKWLWNSYFPTHFPAYCHYRSKRLGQPVTMQAIKGAGGTQQLLLW